MAVNQRSLRFRILFVSTIGKEQYRIYIYIYIDVRVLHLISPNCITPASNSKVTKITEMITN